MLTQWYRATPRTNSKERRNLPFSPDSGEISFQWFEVWSTYQTGPETWEPGGTQPINAAKG